MTKVPMERLISWVLRAGVVISAALLVAGIAASYAGVAAGTGLLTLGVFVLFSTPVVRVLLSVLSFAMERDWLYVAITLVVLIDIMFALFILPALTHI